MPGRIDETIASHQPDDGAYGVNCEEQFRIYDEAPACEPRRSSEEVEYRTTHQPPRESPPQLQSTGSGSAAGNLAQDASFPKRYEGLGRLSAIAPARRARQWGASAARDTSIQALIRSSASSG